MARTIPARVLPHVLGVGLVLIGLFGHTWKPASAAASAGQNPPVDLAAMVLTPADLSEAGFDGYTLLGSESSDDDLAFQVSFWVERTDAFTEITDILESAGLKQTYSFDLGLPLQDSDDSRSLSRVVSGSITEFEDADGPAAALDVVVEMLDESTMVKPVVSNQRLGDGSLLVRDTESQDLEFVFSTDRFLVFIRITDYQDQAPDLDDVQAIGEKQLERVEDGFEGDAPGLSNHVLRLADPEYLQPYEIRADQYFRLDGEDFLRFWDSDSEPFKRAALAGDAVDAYEFAQFFQGVEVDGSDIPFQGGWQSVIYRFASEQDAADWLVARSEHLDASLAYSDAVEVKDVELIEDAPVVGDESFTISYLEDDGSGCGCGDENVRVIARVGAIGLDMSIGTAEGNVLPLDAIASLAALQVDCISGADCLEPVVVTDALAGQAQPADTDKLGDWLDPHRETKDHVTRSVTR